VVNWRIVRGTGNEDLDEAVADMIQRASLPPLPADVTGEVWSPTVPVSFTLN
jgi:protein TonB